MIINVELEYDIDTMELFGTYFGDTTDLMELGYSEDEILRLLLLRYGIGVLSEYEPVSSFIRTV